MKNKRLRGGVQNVCLILLTLSALFLLARLPMLREIRLPGQVPALFSPEASPGGQEEEVLPAAMFPSMNLMVTGDSQYGRYGRLCVSADDTSLQQIPSSGRPWAPPVRRSGCRTTCSGGLWRGRDSTWS